MIAEDITAAGAEGIPNPTMTSVRHSILIGKDQLLWWDIRRVEFHLGVSQEDGLHCPVTDSSLTICTAKDVDHLVT